MNNAEYYGFNSIQQPTTKVVGLRSPSGQNNQVE